ncbi:MAG TPA: DUF6051 family protein [Vicinamibacterales bacterium]|jgi:pimeloyl-ACP methyl ester carboxylesterase
MDYCDIYHSLKSSVTYTPTEIHLGDGTRVVNVDFRSESDWILPGRGNCACPTHGAMLTEPQADEETIESDIPGHDDAHMRENREFRYHVFAPAGTGRAHEVILLFHGFNEKHWHKYLPWAHALVERTGKTVLLFPIAFHMNRAPQAWSDRRAMHRLCEERKRGFPSIIASTLSNAAISTRLQTRPQRFFWSGLQTYNDIVQLVDEIRTGRHPLVDQAATFDLFAYSIGCMLAQILLMTDPRGAFNNSRSCLFCGGAVLNRMSPVSRFILDSECNVALYSYAVEHLESHLRDNERLRHFLGDAHPEGLAFRCMLNAIVRRKEREAHFGRLGSRLLALTLESDTVIPPDEVMNTLQGAARNLPARVDVLEFGYPCRHEDPFPAAASTRGEVDKAFRRVFDRAAGFYLRKSLAK